jgi:hypothetical protein
VKSAASPLEPASSSAGDQAARSAKPSVKRSNSKTSSASKPKSKSNSKINKSTARAVETQPAVDTSDAPGAVKAKFARRRSKKTPQ